MRELEEINCEIRRIVDLQLSVSNQFRNLETEEHGQSTISQECDDASENCRGGFLYNATYAWLSYGCHFVVFNVKVGESVSNWSFRGIVTSVSQFPAQSGDLPLLLVGVDNNASKSKDSSGLLCIFDCATSRVLRAIRMPCGIEQVCVVSGGAEWEEFNDKRPDNVLNEMDGIACVVLRNLMHIMIDLRRSMWDMHDSSAVMNEVSPAEIDLLPMKQTARHRFPRERHAAYNLLNSRIERYIGFNREDFESSPLFDESLTTTILSSTKIGCLISGCLGRIIIWQNDGSVGWISEPLDDSMAVTHLALLEPTDDPRPFYYLWAVFQDESSKTPPVLRMYAMLFERKYCDRGMNLYFNLGTVPRQRFEFELCEGSKVVGLCTVERESNPEQTESGVKRSEDNLLLIATGKRTLLFDLNQWYKEQMPRTIEECQNPNSILAIYRSASSDSPPQQADNRIVGFSYVPLSLQEFLSNGPSSPEELFYPNSLSLEWAELSPTRLTFWMTRGIQADLLREMALAGPIILIQPSETFHRCLSVGLVPYNSEFSLASDQNAQREMLLSLCLEQRWATFLVKCAVEWSDGSASYLYPTFLKWGVQRASAIKALADQLCVPLFDQSGSSIGEADVKTLRFCSQQLECLSSVVAKLPSATAELTKQRRTLKRVSTYFQVLLWFYDVGLLPETQEVEEEEGALPISLALKVPYPYEKLSALYKEKRSQARARSKRSDDNGHDEEEQLFIDKLITRDCPVLKGQWEREGGTDATDGCYPPPSLQSLLRSYLADCKQQEAYEISCKHQITIYLLMDLAMLLQRLYPGVDQLIKYPSAFKMSPSLIKLTQAFWLLDHEDYQGFLDMMTGQLVSDSDVKDWHHRLVLRTLVRNSQHKLALVYLRVRKPPLSSMEEQGVAVSLSVEHGLVQSAFHRRPPCHYEQLLICFFRACKAYGKLDEILHLALDTEEEEVFVKFLEEGKTEDLRSLYYLQRCRYTEAINSHSTIGRHQSADLLAKDTRSTSTLGMLGAYNATLPDITKLFFANAAVTNSDADLETRYPRPMSHCKSHDRLRSIHETVIAKARETYLRGEKCQIPFVSAPCTSLKLSSHGANVNCVLYPALMRKTSRGKRTVDQIYQDEGVTDGNDTPDGDAKRRKLSNGGVSPSRSSSAKESGLLGVTFETPLVKRKFAASTSKDAVTETPQSILKIRHLIRSSMSPGMVAMSQPTEAGLSDGEREKKTNRQIRFSIHESKKSLSYEDENEEMEEGQLDEEEEGREEKETEEGDGSKINVSSDSTEEMFLSPETSVKSYVESAVLSDVNSNNSSRSSYCYPRPRPSLRRSALQSSAESSREFRANAKKTDSGLSASTLLTEAEAADKAASASASAANTSKRSSLLSTSVYSTTVLSSDSNVEISGCSSKKLETSVGSQSRWRLSLERVDVESKFAISSTPLTKSIVSQTRVKAEQRMEADDDDDEENKEEEEESRLRNVIRKLTEDLDDAPSDPNRPSPSTEPPPDYARSDFAERRDHSEEDVPPSVSQPSERSKYNNGSIATRETTSSAREPFYEAEAAVLAAETENPVVESRQTISEDESEEELLRLRDDEEEDNDEHEEEEFESLAVAVEAARTRLEREASVPRSSTETAAGGADERETEGHVVDVRSNSLRETTMSRLPDDIDFTDDDEEHTRSRGATMIASVAVDDNGRAATPTVACTTENILYDLTNITDDESEGGDVGETEEVEETKAKNCRFPSSPGRHATRRSVVETGMNVDESDDDDDDDDNDDDDNDDDDDEESRKSGGEGSVSRRGDDDGISSGPESREKSLLETASSSRRKRGGRVETTADDQSSVRITRSRRAGSLTKDTAATGATTSRSRRGGSLAKDSPSRDAVVDIERSAPVRTRRTSSTRDSPEGDTRSRSQTDKPGARSLRTTTVTAPESPTMDTSRQTDSGRPPRSRRANSATKDIGSPSVRARSRRASSLAKEVLSSASRGGDDIRPGDASPEISSVDATPSVRRGRRRATSMTQLPLEIEIKDSDSESVKDEPLVRRSTRLVSSAKRETSSRMTDATPKNLVKSSEGMSSKLTSDDEEDSKGTRKRYVMRARKISMSSDTEEAATTSRPSSRASVTDLDKKTRPVKAGRGRRGSSVPKETVAVQTGRKCRSSSISLEIVPEVPKSPQVGSRKLRSSVARHAEEIANSPAGNTRGRSASIQSIPEELEEELEEILSRPESRGTTSRRGAARGNARERRASSADVSYVEVKRRLRGARSIANEPILEEPAAESEENRPELRKEEMRTEVDRDEVTPTIAPARRRRAASVTTFEEARKDIAKRNRGRTRRTSASKESRDAFSFSQPDKTDDAPLDEREIGEVPNYVFSPPQTRSKYISLNQHRRKMSSFIPNPYQEGEQQPVIRIQKLHGIDESNRYARITVNTYGSQLRTKFVIPKRSKTE